MQRYIEQQIEEQKRLLYLEIPALKNHNILMRKLRLNLKSESDLLDGRNVNHFPVDRKLLHKKIFSNDTTTNTSPQNHANFKNHHVLGGSEGRLNATNGGIHNPSYSIEDLDDEPNEENYVQSVYDSNNRIVIGALPTPCTESANFAVKSSAVMCLNLLINNCVYY